MCKVLHKSGLFFVLLTKEVTFVMLYLEEYHIPLMTLCRCEQAMNMV